jgi:hypothetical protein
MNGMNEHSTLKSHISTSLCLRASLYRIGTTVNYYVSYAPVYYLLLDGNSFASSMGIVSVWVLWCDDNSIVKGPNNSSKSITNQQKSQETASAWSVVTRFRDLTLRNTSLFTTSVPWLVVDSSATSVLESEWLRCLDGSDQVYRYEYCSYGYGSGSGSGSEDIQTASPHLISDVNRAFFWLINQQIDLSGGGIVGVVFSLLFFACILLVVARHHRRNNSTCICHAVWRFPLFPRNHRLFTCVCMLGCLFVF